MQFKKVFAKCLTLKLLLLRFLLDSEFDYWKTSNNCIVHRVLRGREHCVPCQTPSLPCWRHHVPWWPSVHHWLRNYLELLSIERKLTFIFQCLQYKINQIYMVRKKHQKFVSQLNISFSLKKRKRKEKRKIPI